METDTLFKIKNKPKKSTKKFLWSWVLGSLAEKITFLLSSIAKQWMPDFCKACVMLLGNMRVAIICAEDENVPVLVLQPKWSYQGCKSCNFFSGDGTQGVT